MLEKELKSLIFCIFSFVCRGFLFPGDALSRTCSIFEGLKRIQLVLLKKCLQGVVVFSRVKEYVFFQFVKGMISTVVSSFQILDINFVKSFSPSEWRL